MPNTSSTFAFNGAGGGNTGSMTAQDFVVPPGVTEVLIECSGAQGAVGNAGAPGQGGYIKALVPVTPSETLKVYTGGYPNLSGGTTPNGGDNGGGDSNAGTTPGGGGGGATDVRRSPYALADRLVVGGGGGGGGSHSGGAGSAGVGGDAGYTDGVAGTVAAFGAGGTQSAGGAGGVGTDESGSAGTLGTGGNAGNNGGVTGGAGGAGLYGGGGAGENLIGTNSGGGGGGSSGVISGATIITHTTGAVTTMGSAIITYNTDSVGGGDSVGPLETVGQSDIPFLDANDRYQVVACVDKGAATTTAEFRYWNANAPAWGEAVAGDTYYPAFYTLDELSTYVAGTVELPFISVKPGQEADIKGVLVEFNTRPSSIQESIADGYPLGFDVSVEGYGVPDYTRTITSTWTSGVHTSTTFAYTASVGNQADEPWPNTRSAFFPLRLDQRVRAVRVIVGNIRFVEIVRVQLVGDLHAYRVV